MTAPIESTHSYKLVSLLPAFQEALEAKKAKIGKIAPEMKSGDWWMQYPEGNAIPEQRAVDWLLEEQKKGMINVVTPHPLSDSCVHGFNIQANPRHSLYMQILDKTATTNTIPSHTPQELAGLRDLAARMNMG